MSNKLERLIAELCPDGVEYVALGKIAVRTKGTPITAAQMKALDKPNAPIKIFAGGKTVAHFDYADLPEKDVNTYPSVVVKSRGVIEFEYYDKPFSHKNEMWSYHSERDDVDIKYVYYFLKTQESKLREKATSMGAFPQIAIPDTEQLTIPLPPLSVQHEIVRILDNFTELTARKKQYEYYRNELLTFGDDVPMAALGDASNIYDGTHQTPKYTSEGVRFVSVENINALKQSKKCISADDYQRLYKVKPQKNDVFMTRIGSIGTCTVVEDDEPLAYYVTLTLIRPNQERINSRYLKHAVESIHGKNELWKRTLVHATPIKINLGDVGKIPIPVPPLAEQERIVAILDRFDALTTDISSGLPAEIAARQKQYEYYRDKLLTFKEVA